MPDFYSNLPETNPSHQDCPNPTGKGRSRTPDAVDAMITSLSIVIPAFNEAGAIAGVVRDCLDAGEEVTNKLEIIVINDGSDDGTGELIDRLAAEDSRIVALHHPLNQGVGAATRNGFAAARHDSIFYIDGDGQFDPRQIKQLLPYCKQYDFVVGYRKNRADPPHRLLNARLYNWLLKTVFGLPIRDVNCAFKLIRTASLRQLPCRATTAFYLAEFVISAAQAGMTFREVPVHHFQRTSDVQSGGQPRVILKCMWNLLCYRFFAWRTR